MKGIRMDHRLCPDITAVTFKTFHLDRPAEPDAVRRIVRAVGPAVFGEKIGNGQLIDPIPLPVQVGLRLSSRTYRHIESLHFLSIGRNSHLEQSAIPFFQDYLPAWPVNEFITRRSEWPLYRRKICDTRSQRMRGMQIGLADI